MVVQPASGDTGILINQSPRPRLLVRGFDGQDELQARLRQLALTAQLINGLDDVRQDEWDLLVTDQPIDGVAHHLCVLFVGSSGDAYMEIEHQLKWDGRIDLAPGHISRELIRVTGLPERIAALTHEQLEPVLSARDRHQYFESTRNLPMILGSGNASVQKGAAPAIEPFIASGDGKALAGRYKRGPASEAWLLPGVVPDIVPWVLVALAEWHALAPDRFPGVPDWSQEGQWMTYAERTLTASLDELRREREDLLQNLADREKSLRHQLQDAQAAADTYERALLTTQSKELQRAVLPALEEMGFKVTDADVHAGADDHLEDLHIEDPDAPGWIALGEVKGYKKGAKTEALTQFLRFHIRYVERTAGQRPNASWYIVNQFLARDPSARPLVLNGKDEDVAAFATAGGLVIDTVVLFRLLMQLRDGVVSAEEARRLLRSSTGRLKVEVDVADAQPQLNT